MDPVEIASGLWRWTSLHPDWKGGAAPGSSADWPREVGCVLVETGGAAAFIDALPAAEQQAFWAWADERCAGRRVLALSTISFHRRGRDALVARYRAGTSRAKAKLPPGVEPIRLRGAGETVFWLPEQRTLVPGDRLIGSADGRLRMCPASWLRYLPSGIGVGELRELLRPLLELPVERVLVSHGAPVLGGGRRALAEALE
ncbi:MAG TPA: hypothetical protein VGI27_03405 [Solirubrobacteraceae bacterium]